MKTTGQIIREQREAHGILLRQLSECINIDIALLSKIERGSRKATRDQLEKIADFLNIDREMLLICYLGEIIAFALKDDYLAIEALEAAKRRIRYEKNAGE